MTKPWNLLITDMNPQVRRLLKRELATDGHVVYEAKTWREILERVYGHPLVQVIVLDPELLNVPFHLFFLELRDRIPPIKVVVHAFDDQAEGLLQEDIYDLLIVKKKSRSIDSIKCIINHLQDRKSHGQGL